MTPSSQPARTVRDLRVGVAAVLGEPTVGLTQRLRLAELGIRAGETVHVVQRSVGGARVVSVRDSRIALDSATARQLPVIPGAGEP
ncbi:MAG: ferrous iron transport protein [Actinomycetota bacterium]|jgi:ferrous iron transport protein A|nr:ferrous iron transport protein [Actinomycetota bacterium]